MASAACARLKRLGEHQSLDGCVRRLVFVEHVCVSDVRWCHDAGGSTAVVCLHRWGVRAVLLCLFKTPVVAGGRWVKAGATRFLEDLRVLLVPAVFDGWSCQI